MRSAEDRHTVWLTLTEAGHEKLREVWPDHRDSIYLYFGQYLEVAAHNGTYAWSVTAYIMPVMGGVELWSPSAKMACPSDRRSRCVTQSVQALRSEQRSLHRLLSHHLRYRRNSPRQPGSRRQARDDEQPQLRP